jgi:hypothetical protein
MMLSCSGNHVKPTLRNELRLVLVGFLTKANPCEINQFLL